MASGLSGLQADQVPFKLKNVYMAFLVLRGSQKHGYIFYMEPPPAPTKRRLCPKRSLASSKGVFE